MSVLTVEDAHVALSVLREAVQGLLESTEGGWWDQAVEDSFEPMVMCIGLLDLYLTGSIHMQKDVDVRLLDFILGKECVITLSDGGSRLQLFWPNEQNPIYVDLVDASDENIQCQWDLITEKGENHVRV